MFYYNLIDSVKHAIVEAKRRGRRERTLFTVLMSNGPWEKYVLIISLPNMCKWYYFFLCKETDGQGNC